ncbi:Uu.00g101400.m01.CDS01 [Anthostomella pinea]|uniref:Nuclear pore complex protein Nup85 n=1 Tax=Anthostomella pinea TaxID=933095 RepID=A0AAI8VD53_9PEZI|nr:Uu.00g101400.m01.CDS01 [Anthostomella pinea]
MSFRFSNMTGSPSTPDRNARKGSTAFGYSVDHPSTTPAGPPPPSSAGSFTPAGDPSPSFLQSSIGAMTGKPKAPNFGRPNLRTSGKSTSKGSNAPLGRSIRGSGARQPSSLSREYHAEDEEEEDEEDDMPVNRAGTFTMPYDDTTEGEDTEIDNQDAAEDEYEDEYEEEQDHEAEVEAMMQDEIEYDVEEDLLRELAGEETCPEPFGDGDEDLMMLATPAADARIRREADDLFRASSMRSTAAPKREFKYATLAKDLYGQGDFAEVLEPDHVILQTEAVVARLYDEGVGSEDDEERLDNTLSQACVRLVNNIWTPHTDSLPKAHEEHAAKVGPSSHAPTFEKAMFLANLILRIHHTPPLRDAFGGSRDLALPAVLFQWQADEHNIDGDQMGIISRHPPAPATHALFWQAVFNALIRGNVGGSAKLLRNAGWEAVKKSPRGESSYSGQALANIRRVIEDLCQVMEICPSVASKSWDIHSSDWTLFRLKAKAAKEALISFSEGKDRSQMALTRSKESDFGDSSNSRPSLAGLARKAESQIPWEIYENLQSLYAILIGEPDAILAAAQDWCEATIGLFGWWDDGHNKRDGALSHSRSLRITNQPTGSKDFFERMALSLQTVTESDFHFDTSDPVEVGVACAFEGNVEGVIGFLRLWSLPVASTVAEIASLGRWLPAPEPQNLISMSEFDKEDLDLLGINQSSAPDEKDGIKDTTLIHYAQSLRSRKHISGTTLRGKADKEGWELAVQVVGRMDSPERSEQMVQDLLQNVLKTLNEDSRDTADKIWRLLNELGMINFAEDTAETFGDILARDTFRFGETLWYYALAHRPGKVRDVLNTLMSISLVESTTYPPDRELDDSLRGLLKERTTTLEQFAKQDLEAAELLGKMLSGYATLRNFYELRDGDGKSNQRSVSRRQQAATALTAVIASADDNIRGGLYDDTRDAVVSEDFLLALLGEASVFVGQSPPVVSLEQIDTLLKATEDIQTVGSRVYAAADEFFKLVLASGQGKGSTPASLLGQSTSSLGGSFMMTGSSMIASQLHQSVVKSGMIKGNVKRAWDWRAKLFAGSSSADVLKQIRLGLTRDLANLWLEQADSVIL